MATTFADILKKGEQNFQTPNIAKTARDWYRKKAKEVSFIDERQLMRKLRHRQEATVEMGNMYMFYYSAKWESELPYYDKFPLIFPFDSAPGGFFGLNMHYLPFPLRAKLMDALYDYVSDTKYDKNTQINISYGILKQAARLKYFKPCIKHYLNDHVKSSFVKIIPKEWDVALFLNLARFSGATESKVHKDSRKIINS